MSNLVDFSTRVALTENDVKSLKSSVDRLSEENGEIVTSINEIKLILMRNAMELELKSKTLSENISNIEKIQEKTLNKVEQLEDKITDIIVIDKKSSYKTKVMWGVFVFIASSLGTMFFSILQKKI